MKTIENIKTNTNKNLCLIQGIKLRQIKLISKFTDLFFVT